MAIQPDRIKQTQTVRTTNNPPGHDHATHEHNVLHPDETEINLTGTPRLTPYERSFQRRLSDERRVRIRPKSQNAWNILFGKLDGYNNIISPLWRTNGVVFPYKPAISYFANAEWSPYSLVHTNYQTEAFSRSMPSEITITGAFTAQTDYEAVYAYAAIQFFRVVTKMFYGKRDELAGTPPPTLLFSGLGNGMFNDIPVIVKNFTHELLGDADDVPVPIQGGKGVAWIPAVFNMSVTLGIQQNLTKVSNEFKLSEFASGDLLLKSTGSGKNRRGSGYI